jgi:hypothetical protein
MNARSKSTVLLLVLFVAAAIAAPAFAQTVTGATLVPAKHDQPTTAFGDQPVDLPHGKGGGFFTEHRVKRLPPLPAAPKGKAAPAVNVVQTTATTALNISKPVPFLGISDGPYSVDATPSDTTGAIGSTQYVQWVNEAVQVFNRNGSPSYGPTLGRSLWKDFGGDCEAQNDGDPIVQYDKLEKHWVLSQFAVRVKKDASFLECVAVSMTDDAKGKYARYAYGFSDFNDYPKVGVWSDGYYFTFNMFDANDQAIGGKICAVQKKKVLAGDDAPMQCFDVADFGLLPADIDGAAPPPPGSPELVMNFTRDALQLWKVHIDWDHPTKSTLTGPVRIAVAAFSPACASGPCIEQKGTTQKLDTLSDRLMFRLAYRNFGDHDSLVVNHAVSVTGGATSGMRWYEIRNPFTAPSVIQSTYAPGTSARWMGSVAMDKQGNMLAGYSASGSSLFPSIMIAGRAAGDPKGTLSKEMTAVPGSASQTDSNRWGDYANMTVDPTDDCTFWFTTEVMDKTHTRWQTQIVHTKFNNCT